MNAVTLDEVIDSAMQLPDDQRQMLISILQMRQIEARRREIAHDAQEALAAYRMQKLNALPIEETLLELRRTLDGDK